MSQSESNKITPQETEKLKALVKTVRDMEDLNVEITKGGGTKVEDSVLDRAKRAVDSYTKYLAEQYGQPAESFLTNLETQPKKVEAGESGSEKVNTTSPPNVEKK